MHMARTWAARLLKSSGVPGPEPLPLSPRKQVPMYANIFRPTMGGRLGKPVALIADCWLSVGSDCFVVGHVAPLAGTSDRLRCRTAPI